MVAIVVAGSNSDWGKPIHIDDAVYAHLKQKWIETDPPVTELDTDNKSWDEFGQFHLYVQRRETTENRMTIDNTMIQCVTTLNVHCVMQRLTMGLLPNTIQNAATHVKSLFWMYSPHWIAGIQEFGNIREVPIDEPDTPANPFRNTYHIIVQVDAYYTKNTDFAMDTATYNPATKTAGQLTYLP